MRERCRNQAPGRGTVVATNRYCRTKFRHHVSEFPVTDFRGVQYLSRRLSARPIKTICKLFIVIICTIYRLLILQLILIGKAPDALASSPVAEVAEEHLCQPEPHKNLTAPDNTLAQKNVKRQELTASNAHPQTTVSQHFFRSQAVKPRPA